MPFGTLEDAFKEALATAPSDVAVLDTIEISHPDVAETFFLVANTEDLDLTLETSAVETFTGVAFQLTLPGSGEAGLQSLSLSLDNVDRRIVDFLNTVADTEEVVTCKYRPYLSNDLSQPQMNPPLLLTLHDVVVGTFQVTATARFLNLINKQFPSELYTRASFPSLGQ